MDTTKRESFVFTNGSEKIITLIIEPWGEQFNISPNSSVEVIGLGGEITKKFEIEYFLEGIIVYGWEGSTVSVMKDGMELEQDFQE